MTKLFKVMSYLLCASAAFTVALMSLRKRQNGTTPNRKDREAKPHKPPNKCRNQLSLIIIDIVPMIKTNTDINDPRNNFHMLKVKIVANN
jgi:hypothetical protein